MVRQQIKVVQQGRRARNLFQCTKIAVNLPLSFVYSSNTLSDHKVMTLLQKNLCVSLCVTNAVLLSLLNSQLFQPPGLFSSLKLCVSFISCIYLL